MNDGLKDPRQALQRIDAMPMPVQQDPMTLLTMAVEKGADVGTLERLAVLRDKFMAEQAKNAFFSALAQFQAEIPVIVRHTPGHDNRYSYAKIEQIVKELKPFLLKHGFSHQEDSIVTDGWVEAIVIVTHSLGHREEKRFKVPAESKAGMSLQQKYGAALTYATRKAFCLAFGVVTADKDTDCPPSGEGPEVVIGLKAMLWKLLTKHKLVESGHTWNTARQFFVDEGLLDMDTPPEDLDSAGWRKLLASTTKRLEGK